MNILDVFAAGSGDVRDGMQKLGVDSGVDVNQAIKNVTSTIFVIMGIVAVFVIILGGFNMMTSSGDPGKVKKGKDTILWGVIGLVVAILAYAIVNFVLQQLF